MCYNQIMSMFSSLIKEATKVERIGGMAKRSTKSRTLTTRRKNKKNDITI